MRATTYLGSGDASRQRRDYRAEWLDNLAGRGDDVGSVLSGIGEGPGAVRAIRGVARTLYETGAGGDHRRRPSVDGFDDLAAGWTVRWLGADGVEAVARGRATCQGRPAKVLTSRCCAATARLGAFPALSSR